MPIVVQITLGKEEKILLQKLVDWISQDTITPEQLADLSSRSDVLQGKSDALKDALNKSPKGAED